MAATGTTMASFTVSTSRRTLTNWLGNSASSALSNMARSFTVPVVVSIWLSVVASLPWPSWFFCARSSAVTGRMAPSRRRLRTGGSASSGMVNITEIGWIWVMTHDARWRRPRCT